MKKKEKTKDVEIIKDENEKKSFMKIFSNILLIISLITFIGYTVIEMTKYNSFLNFLPKLLGIVFIFLILICFIFQSFKNKKGSITTIIFSFLVIIYCIINSLLTLNILHLPSDEYIPNFYNKSLMEVNKWKKDNQITVIENYEYSDKIAKYNIISQDKLYPNLTKDIKELNVIISLGPDLEKEVIVPNFVGKKIDDVIKYIEDNFLSNVTIKYEISQKEIDTILSQDGNGSLRRNSPITLTVAKGETIEEVSIIDFTNKSLLYAQSWLERKGFKVKISYDFSETIEANYVIRQNVVNEVKNPETDEIELIVSKGKMVVAPDIANMNTDEINKWIIDNNLKVSYSEEYSDTEPLGDVISSSIKKDDVIANGEKVEIVISKGTLTMINLTDINEFINWATTNELSYDINYEYNETVKKDAIIKCSHKTGETIKKDDTIIVTISKGKSIVIPNFIGMNKTNIQSKCAQINLNCSFKTGSKTEKTPKDIAIGQSKNANTTVSEGTSLVITISAGIIEKVNVPNFVGKSKNTISQECSKLGITCNFTYQKGYSDTSKDTAVSQLTTGTVNKGSKITITLSNGPAKTYTIIIDANQLSSGNPSATKATLEKKLKNACPGVNFNFKYVTANSGIGYLAPSSDVKVGSNKLVQGKTYNVIINSN